MRAIGVMGSSSGTLSRGQFAKAREIGRRVALSKSVLFTGACPGLPLEAALGAKEENGVVIGVSPALNEYEHVRRYKYPRKPFDAIVYTGFGYKGRNVVLVRSSHAVIVLRGGMGTLNEFTIAFDEGKIIGVLGGMGGISDSVKRIINAVERETQAKIIYESNPAVLVKKIVEELGRRGMKKVSESKEPGIKLVGRRSGFP